MCGIIAYKGEGNAVFETIISMEKLEYRGYDSAGIAYINNNSIALAKQPGCVADLMHKLDINANASLCIGHTRWATHGAASRRNAHPHLTKDGRLAIVHNGIIENYLSLKKEMKAKGYEFLSDTDSEILLYLIYDHFMNDAVDLYGAVKLALSRVVGAYAFIVIDRHSDNSMVCARKGSPLVIGLNKKQNSYYVSSDICAFPKSVDKVVYVQDNTVVKVDRDIEVYDISKDQVSDYKVEKIQKEWLNTEKDIYDHFMQKEIYEQPVSVSNAIAGRLDGYRVVFGGLSDSKQYIKRSKHITIVACGTSYNVGLLGKYYIEEFTNKKVSVEYASEFRYRKINNLYKDDMVIGISQSGETADTIEALKRARKYGCKVLGICNGVNSSISRLTDCGIYIKAGIEIGVASTKAFNNQAVCLCLLAMWMDQQQEDWITNADKRKTIISSIKELNNSIIQALNNDVFISKIASKYKSYNKFLFIGRQYNYPVALEGALKMKELCYNYAEGYAAAELKHGPLALVDKKTVAIVINNDPRQQIKMGSTMQEIKSRGGKIINIDYERKTKDLELIAPSELVDDNIVVPNICSCLSPMLSVIPLQLLAYHSAIARGKNVDRPRNLAKSVTVE